MKINNFARAGMSSNANCTATLGPRFGAGSRRSRVPPSSRSLPVKKAEEAAEGKAAAEAARKSKEAYDLVVPAEIDWSALESPISAL